MSKRRSDWAARPQARFLTWLRDGFGSLDEGIMDSLSQEVPHDKMSDELAAQRQEHVSAQRFMRDARLEQEATKGLQQWAQHRGRKLINRLYAFMALTVGALLIYFMLETVALMPRFGAAAVPVNNEVSARYIESGLEETGAVNIVAGMILDYRAFDTLGESTVLFIAACAVLILLRIDRDKDGKPDQEMIAMEADDRHFEPKNDRILQGSAMVLTPIIFLFGIYVILNGHLSPGGGFSGGAIISAGLILYLNAFGFAKAGRFFTYKTFTWVSFCALMFYGLAKTYSFYCGANGLESGIPLGIPGSILSSGLILPLNIAVGMVVTCTMYIFYALFRKGEL